MSNWQAIESAPKDRMILLYRPLPTRAMGDVMPGIWDDDKYSKRPRPYWESWSKTYSRTEARSYPPTHWMPLPEPPND